jgi:hypothetical protein
MGRTHKTLSYEQERKLHRDGQVSRVKGIHRWGDNRRTSNRSPAHVDSDSDEDDNPVNEGILNVFKNGISDPVFSESFLEELQNDSDEMNFANLMISYLDRIITDENISNVPNFGDMSDYDSEDFRNYVNDYFRFINQITIDSWIETYSSL